MRSLRDNNNSAVVNYSRSRIFEEPMIENSGGNEATAPQPSENRGHENTLLRSSDDMYRQARKKVVDPRWSL